LTTLVDTNVFVDIWSRDPEWGEWSAAALAETAERDELAVNPVIYAELCPPFASEPELDRLLTEAGIERLPLPYAAAWPAARAFVAYRERGGARTAPLPDFFIGAHALVADIPLMTRDPRRYETYFPGVRLIAPQ